MPDEQQKYDAPADLKNTVVDSAWWLRWQSSVRCSDDGGKARKKVGEIGKLTTFSARVAAMKRATATGVEEKLEYGPNGSVTGAWTAEAIAPPPPAN